MCFSVVAVDSESTFKRVTFCYSKTKGYGTSLKYIFVHLTSINWNTEFICHHLRRKLLLIAGLLSTLSPAYSGTVSGSLSPAVIRRLISGCVSL